MNTRKITLRSKGLRIELFAEPEDIDPADQFEYPEDIAFARDGLASGNEWAWCTAHVRVTYTTNGEDYTADQYLGGCAYHSAEDFKGSKFLITGPRGGKRPSRGYYDDMIGECIADINAQIARVAHFDACEHCKAVRGAGRTAAFPHPVA